MQNNTSPSLFKDLPDTQTSEKQEAEIEKPAEAPKSVDEKRKKIHKQLQRQLLKKLQRVA